MRSAIRKRMGDFIAILALVVIAIPVAAYILHNERLRFPVIEKAPLQLKAEFVTAQAVIPGQGQTVRVHGVRIGDIGPVHLKNGRAYVTMNIDPKYDKLIHTNASALLRPKTGLKDMFIEVDPGSANAPIAKKNFMISIANTLPDINPDEFLATLDADTRSYLKLLINGAGQGLDKRGLDLREVFKRFEPTHRSLALFSQAVAQRQVNLRRLVNSLQRLNTELGHHQNDISQLISTSAVVFRAFASEDRNISRAIQLFPGALHQTTSTLGKVTTFARVLRSTAPKLEPPFKALNNANPAIAAFSKVGAPILRKQIRPFVRDVRPLVRELKAPAQNLAKATPSLTKSFKVLNDLFNFIAYNPKGAEGPTVANRQEGYLFLIGWLGHEAVNVLNSNDANGSYRPVTLDSPCDTAQTFIDNSKQPDLIAFMQPVLAACDTLGP